MPATITLVSTDPIRPALVNGQGACLYLDIGRSHLHSLMREGRLVPVRLGAAVRFRISDLDRLIAESMTGTEA